MENGNQARWVPVVVALGIGALGVGLLTDAAAVSTGVRRGLEVCGAVLIPSLFPFMVLSGFLSLTDYARILSFPLRPITTRVFKLPGEMGIIVLLSLIGGYPVGAKMIANLLDEGRIDQRTAERMLCFCVNSGPSFLISAVGMGMLFSRQAGMILFGTQTATTLLIGWLVSRKVRRPEERAITAPERSTGTALVMAVQGGTTGMLTMCAFAILFSGLLSMLTEGGMIKAAAALLPVSETGITAVLSGFLEVTSGCIAAAKVGGAAAFGLTSAIVSFGGLSVLFQIFSCFGSRTMRFRPLVISRLAHAGISTVMAVPLFKAFCGDIPVWASAVHSTQQLDSRTTLISVCLLGMCTIFTLSLGNSFHSHK